MPWLCLCSEVALKPTMVSTALSQLLERARTRFGLEVEILDARLQHVYPESGSELGRLIGDSPTVRRNLLDALAAGRPESLERGGFNYRVVPLRRSTRLRHSGVLLAVRRTSDSGSPGVEPWSELARAIVEADFAAADVLNEERLQSRRLLGTLRFLRHLVDTATDADLSNAVVQAAAVWFDVDARIYERDLAGDLVLQTALPGAQVEEQARRLNSLWVPGSGEIARLPAIPEWSQPAAGNEVVLVPLAAGPNPERVLALLGTVPAHAEAVLPVLGRVVGVQIETLRARRRQALAERFEGLVGDLSTRIDQVPTRVVEELQAVTGAVSAALTLNRGGRLRNLVSAGSIGSPAAALAPSAAPVDWMFGPDQFVCQFQLEAGVSASLELRPAPGETFNADAALAARVGGAVLHHWLRGAESILRHAPSVPAIARQEQMSEFIGRIEEELERAKRFDLRLSLLLIDVPPQAASEQEVFARLQDAVRRELRGSDVLGKMNGQRVAALLTHTDGPGSSRVVNRLRRRLAEAAVRLNLAGVTIGHAVFSPDCRTAEALVSHAVRYAEPVATHP